MFPAAGEERRTERSRKACIEAVTSVQREGGLKLSLRSAMASFGTAAKAKLSNPAVKGAPEDQLRSPLEHLIGDVTELCGIQRSAIAAVGESSLASLKIRPDYAVTRSKVLVGFIEVKAPGKGADPRKFKDPHDKEQWAKLRSLPNLLFTDGNAFSLWRSGELVGSIIAVEGDVETSGAQLDAPSSLVGLFGDFFQWKPIPPRDAKQLAETTARMCRLLRDEVTEQLEIGSPALTELAADWRKLLFPDATDAQFADGYAQAVTFGLLMARASDIDLDAGLQEAARKLGPENSLIGTALRVLTDDAAGQAALTTSIGTLTRVLGVVDWKQISKGKPDAWLYFYEDFLSVYDNALRKQTGSYYTPPEVVAAMVRLVDEALRTKFELRRGLASPQVTLVDPAVGTGTFLLGVMRSIASTVESDEGPGAVPEAVGTAMRRLLAFEIQLGPFVVAQLRVLAELRDLTGAAPAAPLRMFVTDTLGNPFVEDEYLPQMMKPIAESRRQANKIKRDERIMVVIGNPPYKEKAKGRGGWVESGSPDTQAPPLDDWMPPKEWGVGAHAKHLRNLYVYFWRWATWKVFDRHPDDNKGIVCFITVAGFLDGDGFQKMRDYLRRTADGIWVIDCSPEGHRPEVRTRIFEAVQQPVCIVLAARSPKASPKSPATVNYLALPAGPRAQKFAALERLALSGDGWKACPMDWRAPFIPRSIGAWSTFPALDDLFTYNGSGVMPGRTWVIAPDAQSLHERWKNLTSSPMEAKELLFHPHLLKSKPGDRHSKKVLTSGLPGYDARPKPVADEHGPCVAPTRYGFRSFDRQWIIPDNRLINRPNPELWQSFSSQQVFLTVPEDSAPTGGPALTLTGLIPDMHHYNGRGGRVYPLWLDRAARTSNFRPLLLEHLGRCFGRPVSGEDLLSYIVALAAHPAFAARFRADLTAPGIRIPITADGSTFAEVVDVGRSVVWLHSFGERFSGTSRPVGPPRLPAGRRPIVQAGGAIPGAPVPIPNELLYDEATSTLHIGSGRIDGVPSAVWEYEVSGTHVLRHWFSYRKGDRDRPIIGDRRKPSPLGNVQPDHWLAEYTTELLDLLNVLGMLVELESRQAQLLERVCRGVTISASELTDKGAFGIPRTHPTKPSQVRVNEPDKPDLFGKRQP